MARKPSSATKPDHPVPPGIAMPAVYTNHAHVSWAGGVIRLTMSEAMDGQIIPRSALLITVDQAQELQSLIGQALSALTPRAAEAVCSVTEAG